MSARTARLLPWLILLGVGTMYGVAFALPAADLAVTTSTGPTSPWSLSGHSAFGMAWTVRAGVWLANPLFWAAALLLALRLWVPAATFALFAFWVAGWEAVADRLFGTGNAYFAGYWLWAGSMAGLAAAGAAGWWFVPPEYHTRPRDLVRGWRKVPTVLVPAAGLTLLGVLWFDVFGPAPAPPAASPVTVTPRTVAGVVFEIEEQSGDGASATWDNDFLWATGTGRPEVRYENGVLSVGGVVYGPPAAGDTVRVKTDGTVLVNGRPRSPVGHGK